MTMSDEKAAPTLELHAGDDFVCVWGNEHVRVNARYASGIVVMGIESMPIDGDSGPWFTCYSNRPIPIVFDTPPDDIDDHVTEIRQYLKRMDDSLAWWADPTEVTEHVDALIAHVTNARIRADRAEDLVAQLESVLAQLAEVENARLRQHVEGEAER